MSVAGTTYRQTDNLVSGRDCFLFRVAIKGCVCDSTYRGRVYVFPAVFLQLCVLLFFITTITRLRLLLIIVYDIYGVYVFDNKYNETKLICNISWYTYTLLLYSIYLLTDNAPRL